jgi:glutaredoxin-like YruB-family protein
MKVVIYSTPTCGYCQQAKRYLHEKGVPFSERDVSIDQAAAKEMVDLTGQMGVPVIAIDGEVVIGFDRGRLDTLLSSQKNSTGGATLGASVADALQVAHRYGITAIPGALVGRVSSGSPAQKAGLREGDIIQDFNRQPVSDATTLQSILANTPSGGYVTLIYMRAGQRIATEIRV